MSELIRTPGSVFVNVELPEMVQPLPLPPGTYERAWATVAAAIAAEVGEASEAHGSLAHMGSLAWVGRAFFREAEKKVTVSFTDEKNERNPRPTQETQRTSPTSDMDTPPTVSEPQPTPEPLPTIDELFENHLPRHIEASRWGRYIASGPACRVFDGTIFVYHDPCYNFWDLYNLSKGIFRDLGILLSKTKGVWEARIPIRVLTDRVFVESGLAAVEKVLLAYTGIDPSDCLSNFRSESGKVACASGMPPISVVSASRNNLATFRKSQIPPRKPARTSPVLAARLKSSCDFINARVAEERAYWKHNDVAAKHQIALKLLAENEGGRRDA